MASKSSSRAAQSLFRRLRRCSICSNSAAHPSLTKAGRQLSTATARMEESHGTERPRWSYTPEKMIAPFNPRIKDPRKAWTKNNKDPAKLDAMYISLLGRGGHRILTEEVKWLAVTHKSFDQGRRGFNDRLAFLGKRILELQGNFALLNSPPTITSQTAQLDPYERTPFRHPALEGLQNITAIPLSDLLTKDRLAMLASTYGIRKVTRWRPRNPANLDGSGQNVVYTTSLYAIIGALALQKGGDFANKVARDKVLKPLGI